MRKRRLSGQFSLRNYQQEHDREDHRKKLAIPMWGNFVVFIGIYLVYLWNK